MQLWKLRSYNKVTQVRATLLTRELKLNGGQADFYSGTRRAHKADGIAGSKFEIFCRHFSSLRPRPLSAFLFFISLTHTRFWHAFQSGWLPRKPRNRSVTRTIEEVKGDFDSFSNGNDGRAMKSHPILLWSIRTRNRHSLNLEILLIVLLIFHPDSYLILLQVLQETF